MEVDTKNVCLQPYRGKNGVCFVVVSYVKIGRYSDLLLDIKNTFKRWKFCKEVEENEVFFNNSVYLTSAARLPHFTPPNTSDRGVIGLLFQRLDAV